MPEISFWDFKTGICGTVLDELPSNKPHRKDLWLRKEGSMMGKFLLSDIPDSSIITITSSDCRELGKKILKIILTHGDSSSPILDAINIKIGSLTEELSRSKEREEAAISAKEVEAWKATESTKATADRINEEIEKIKKAAQTQEGIPMGRRRLM